MRDRFSIGTVAFAFALGVAPALAQETRPAVGEKTGSTAVARGGSESRGGSASGGAESRAGGSDGGRMSGGGSMGSSSSPSAPSSSSVPERSSLGAPPQRADQSAQGRRGGGESTGRSAVPRGSNGGGSGDNSARVSGGSRSNPDSNGSNGSTRSVDRATGQRRAVPVYGRPRDGRTVTGEAVERGALGYPPVGNRNIYVYRPYYYPYGFWGPGYGFGLGYLYYDPFWYGGFGYGGYGYGGYGYPGYYGGGYYGGSGSYGQSRAFDTGSLRLKIKPREAQVFVDGYFVGEVDSFDGTFQKLNIDSGGHRVEIKADGFEPLQLDVLITAGETVTYKGEMKRIQ
jgi:hypothetical protein